VVITGTEVITKGTIDTVMDKEPGNKVVLERQDTLVDGEVEVLVSLPK
jgi:hypothetical protein